MASTFPNELRAALRTALASGKTSHELAKAADISHVTVRNTALGATSPSLTN